MFKGRRCDILTLLMRVAGARFEDCEKAEMKYAPVMELVDMRDLGDVTSVKVFIPVTRRTHSLVKAGLSCFINADQALSSASVPRRVKTEGNKIATGCPAAHICACDGIGRHARFRYLYV